LKKVALTVLLLALSLAFNGCSWFRRGPKSPPPPPIATKQAPAGPAAPIKRRPAARTSPAARQSPQPTLKPQPGDATPASAAREPVLGQLETEEQRAEYRRAYEDSSSEADRLLLSFSSRKLAKDQFEAVARIRSFLQQAADARANDWSLAASLARRAAILARELAERFQ
jgi:hypothetical protein